MDVNKLMQQTIEINNSYHDNDFIIRVSKRVISNLFARKINYKITEKELPYTIILKDSRWEDFAHFLEENSGKNILIKHFYTVDNNLDYYFSYDFE